MEPLHLGVVGGGPRYRVVRDAPPAGFDELVDREVPLDIPGADDVVEPGVRHEDHVGVRAGRDGGQRPAGPQRKQVRYVFMP